MRISPEERLVEFVEAVAVLERNKFFPACLRSTLHVDLAKPGDGQYGQSSVTLAMTDLDTDSLKSFLVTFRRFTMVKDICALGKVHNAALTIMRGSKAERWIRLSKIRIKYAEDIGSPTSARLDEVVRPIEFFNLWIYAHPTMFHQNENAPERRIWDEIKGNESYLAIVESMALQFIQKMTSELIHLRNLIQRTQSGSA
jgi:hypothetical protein